MRRLAQLAVWVAAVLAAASVIAIATSGAAPRSGPLAPDEGLPVRPPPVQGQPDPPDPGAADAARAPGRQPAAAADVAASLALARNDVTLRKIIGSTPYTVTSSQPWTTGDGSRQLGTQLEVKLDAPISGAMRLPGIRFNPDGSSYRPLALNAQVADASTLTLLVDLQSKRVVSVMPPDSALTELPGNEHSTPASGPNGD